MKSLTKAIFLIGALTAFPQHVAYAQEAQEPVSIESLLNEMIDRDSIARYPQADFRLKQDTSYNRVSKTPDEPEGWFANSDFNSKRHQGRWLRTEENSGQTEWVIMEDEGPGVIVRTWMPFRTCPKT